MNLSINCLRNVMYSAAIMGVLLWGCSKKSGSEVPCFTHVNPDTLRFVVLNKASQEDLFFSDAPAHDTTELKLFVKRSGDEFEPAYQGVEGDGTEIHFVSYVYPPDTIFMQIADLPLDTIAFTGELVHRPCPQSLLAEVTFNKETPQKEAHGRVVRLYRTE